MYMYMYLKCFIDDSHEVLKLVQTRTHKLYCNNTIHIDVCQGHWHLLSSRLHDMYKGVKKL